MPPPVDMPPPGGHGSLRVPPAPVMRCRNRAGTHSTGREICFVTRYPLDAATSGHHRRWAHHGASGACRHSSVTRRSAGSRPRLRVATGPPRRPAGRRGSAGPPPRPSSRRPSSLACCSWRTVATFGRSGSAAPDSERGCGRRARAFGRGGRGGRLTTSAIGAVAAGTAPVHATGELGGMAAGPRGLRFGLAGEVDTLDGAARDGRLRVRPGVTALPAGHLRRSGLTARIECRTL
jgi:hypothetical protein